MKFSNLVNLQMKIALLIVVSLLLTHYFKGNLEVEMLLTRAVI